MRYPPRSARSQLPCRSLPATADHRHRQRRHLPGPQLALAHGGSVATREKNGQQIPEHGAYRLTLAVEGAPRELARQSWRGRVVIAGASEPPALAFVRSALAVLWREAGF
ncbi:MAG TPA: hypothetical protein VJ673_24275 [Aromatoleum sp.]|uniref:hypothetical protein n=1 Tax=Aromatoleum sp. TaxID=2307007 RepID=UPI002B4A59FE|nr:hypothetical protein [Aromatoleum sp.]HJV28815.1 hypothetical protein [Aromatoleum sp.]